MSKLHPNAVPRKEGHATAAYADLLELCQAVLRAEGWDRYMQAVREPGTRVVKIVQTPAANDWTRDPEIVFMGSEPQFEEGSISRQEVRAECLRFLRR